MSGNYQNWNQDAPGGLSDTVAQAQSGLTSAVARVEERQAQSAAFIVENGAAVIGGHSDVGVDVPGDATPMTGGVFDPRAV